MLSLQLQAIEFACERGAEVEASLGEGVIMRTCSWEKSSGNFIRVGPLQLVKNGILILQLQTDENGRLHGPYNAWDDNGVLVESGTYEDGLREGEWQVTSADGQLSTLYFRAGKPLGL